MEQKKEILSFHFLGYADIPSSNDNINFIDLASKLNSMSSDISGQITTMLRKGFKNHISSKAIISVGLSFRHGSLEWEGVVTILDWMARIGSSISFMDYAMRLIRSIIDRVVSERVQNIHGNVVLTIETEVWIPQNTPNPIETNTKPNLVSKVVNVLFTPQQILIAITLFNFCVLVGGSFYTYFSVKSIQTQSFEASEAIAKTRDKYQETLGQLVEFQLNSRLRLENIVDSMKVRISSDSKSIMEQYSSLEKQINSLQSSVNRQDSLVAVASTQALTLSAKITDLESSLPHISFLSLLERSSLSMQTFIVFCFISILYSIIAIAWKVFSR